MKYAVIRLNGKQHRVHEKQEILVDRIGENQDITPEVLMLREDESIKLGNPVIKGVNVTLKRLGDEKGEKISVFKYKSKSRYRKKIGSRPKLTRILVQSIG